MIKKTVFFKIAFFLSAAIFPVLMPAGLEAKSIIREGEPFITLKNFRTPPEVRQGEIFPVYADFITNKNLWKEESFFLHLVNPSDGKILVNADFEPSTPTVRWTPGQVMKFGPIDMYCPEGLKPGVYNVKMGLYTGEEKDGKSVSVREPYTNKDIIDFVAGNIVVQEALPERVHEPLVICDFKEEADIYKWDTRDAVMERVPVGEGKGEFAAKITFAKEVEFPAVILESFFKRSHPKYSNWGYFDELEFEMYKDPDEEGSTKVDVSLIAQVKDKSGRRFKFDVVPDPEKGKPVKLAIQKASAAIDLAQVGNFTLFDKSKRYAEKTAYLSYVKLVARKKEGAKGPFVKFEGLKLSKDKLKPGEVLQLEAVFSTSRPFLIDHEMFLHVFRSKDGAGRINADTPPPMPTTLWKVNEPVKIGPLSIYIPEDNPPGKYDIRMGLFIARNTPAGARYIKTWQDKEGVYHIERPRYPVDYFRQPYVNYKEYGGWVVGSFEVMEE